MTSADHPDGLPDLVTSGSIARRLHLTRGRAAAAIDSEGFPAPLGLLRGAPVWRWADVRRWAERAQGTADGPSAEAMRVAGIRDHFRAAGFRLKVRPAPDGDGWRATRIATGDPRRRGDPFEGATALEAAERAMEWLQTHH